MSPILKVGQRTIDSTELLPLLQHYQLLPRLVQELVIEDAIAPIEYTPAQLHQARATFCQDRQLKTPQQLQQWLQQHHTTPEALSQKLARSLKLQIFKQQRWGTEINATFQAQKDELDQVTYSLLRTQDAGVAQELYFRLVDGEATFAELAAQYSQGFEAQTQGKIGPVPITHLHPAIAQILRRSQPGQIWQPLRVEDWVVIVRLEEYQPAQLNDAMINQLLEHNFQQWLHQQPYEVLCEKEVLGQRTE